MLRDVRNFEELCDDLIVNESLDDIETFAGFDEKGNRTRGTVFSGLAEMIEYGFKESEI